MAWAELRNSRIVVRSWQPGDLPAFVAVHRDPDVLRWSPISEEREARDEDGLREVLEREAAAADAGEPAGFAVTDHSGDVLGEISYRFDLPRPMFAVADVGYMVLPSARGRGVASGALALLTQWLLDTAGADLTRVQLDHAVENEGSCRTATRAGFAREGVRPAYLRLRVDPSGPARLHATCLHGRVRDGLP